jgi:hypothetical protein
MLDVDARLQGLWFVYRVVDLGRRQRHCNVLRLQARRALDRGAVHPDRERHKGDDADGHEQERARKPRLQTVEVPCRQNRILRAMGPHFFLIFQYVMDDLRALTRSLQTSIGTASPNFTVAAIIGTGHGRPFAEGRRHLECRRCELDVRERRNRVGDCDQA